MKKTLILFSALMFASFSFAAHANIDAEEFVEEASAKGVANVEISKLALEKGSASTQEYARKIINDHEQANQKLAEIATQQNVEISDEPSMVAKAKKMMLELRDDSFDEAYASDQVEVHNETIELFKNAAASDLGELSEFARETLPKLEEHLEMAKKLEQEASETAR
jgi:putative membrane protein